MAQHQTLDALYTIINNGTNVTDFFGNITYQNITDFSTEIEDGGIFDYSVYTSAADWWYAATANATTASYQTICSFIINAYECQYTEYEAEKEQREVYEQEDRYDSILDAALREWYTIDLDSDEMITVADLELARTNCYDCATDGHIGEFNHFDTNQDGIVTRDEYWEVKKSDYDSFIWFYIHGEYTYTIYESDFIDNGLETITGMTFSDFDTSGNGYIYRNDVCKIWFGADLENLCSTIYGDNYTFTPAWYKADSDADEVISADEFNTLWTSFYYWMSNDETEVDFASIDVNNTGNVTFDQVKTIYDAREQEHIDWWNFWRTSVDNGWTNSVNLTNVETNWTSISANTTYVSSVDTAITWFNRFDLDKNGVLQAGEGCSVFYGRHCSNYINYDEAYVNWEADWNYDGYMSYAEYARYNANNSIALNQAMFNDWYAKDANTALLPSWEEIQVKQNLLNSTFQEWVGIVQISETLAGSTGNFTYGNDSSTFYNLTDGRTVSTDLATYFPTEDFASYDTNGDGLVSDREFCFARIQVEIVCMDEIDRDFYLVIDTDGNGEATWEEFWAFGSTEEGLFGDNSTLTETSAKLMFELYDIDND